MMKLIFSKPSLIYRGTFDSNETGKDIIIDIPQVGKVSFNLNDIVSQTSKNFDKLSITQIKQVCSLLKISITLYPNGKVYIENLISNNEIAKECYVEIVMINKLRYMICIAFEEVQPCIYEAYLVAVVEI